MPEAQPSQEAVRQASADHVLFEYELRPRGHEAIWVYAHGELDITNAQPFADVLKQDLSELLVIVDLRELTFIDSAGIHALIQADAHARLNNRRLVIIPGSGQVNRVLEVVGLSDHLNIVDLGSTLASPPSHQVDGLG